MTYGPYGTNLFSSFPSLAMQSAAAPAPTSQASYGGFPTTGVPSMPSSTGLPGGGSPFSTSIFANNFPNIQQDVGTLTGQAVGNALPYYQSAIGATQNYYGRAAQPYKQMIAQAQPEVNQYEAMLGALGKGPQEQAIRAFYADPALQAQLQMGAQAQNAADAASGSTGSGNATIALDRLNQQIATQQWNTQLQQLQPFLQQMTQGETGLSNIRAAEGQGVSGGLNTIGGMMYGAPFNEMNNLTQLGIGAQNASSANLAALTGLGSGLFQGLGTALGGFLRSDVNVKENIEPVGKLADGMNIYRYSYKDDPTATPHIGLLAQEVEQIAPEAVAEIEPGVKGVNYARATDRAAALMKMANDNVSSPLIIYGSGLMERAA